MAWAVTVTIPRQTDPEVVNYKTNLGGIFQATGAQPVSGNPQYVYAMAIDGTYSLTATALDAAGNESPQSPALSVNLDHVAPGSPALMVFVSAVWS